MDKKSPLDGLTVASPCSEDWEKMTGDARVRACGACRLNVYNLSEMTRAEAEALIRLKEGRLCVRFYRRADGTVLTKDCPVGLRAARLKLARLTSAWCAYVLSVAYVIAGAVVDLGEYGKPVTPNPDGPSASHVKGRPNPLVAVMGAPPPVAIGGGLKSVDRLEPR